MSQEKTFRLISGLLLTVLFLSACGPAQVELEATATQVTPAVLETRTAAAPSPTPSPTLTIKPTATSPSATTKTPMALDGLIAYLVLGNQSNPTSDAIYVIDPQMPDFPMLLSSYPMGDLYPAWSSDGQFIAVTSARYGDNVDIFLLPVDGSEVIRLTDDPSIDAQLDWSPDDQRVAFVSLRDGDQELYLADRDGSHVERLTDDPGQDNNPAWSPDGNQIAFTSDRRGNRDIYLLDLVGGGLTQLTSSPEDELQPKWSADGNQIVFTSYRDDNLDLYLMNADGSNVQRLTYHPAFDEHPSWSPDGAYIAFDSDRGGDYDIYVIELANGEVVQLTTDPRDEVSPDWGQTNFDFGTDPWFGYSFCIRDVDNDFSPDEPTETYFTTDTLKYVAFQFRNMQNGMDWGHQIRISSAFNTIFNAAWDSGPEGFYVLFLQASSSNVGPFTIELYIEGELIREITCEVVEP